jgi:hypothetical protein
MAVNEAAKNTFGFTVVVKPYKPRNEIVYSQTREQSPVPAPAASKPKQSTLDRFMLDKAIVEASKKKKGGK